MLVIVDDFSRFTWVIFITTKDEAFVELIVFIKRIQKQSSFVLSSIRSDHGREFENETISVFCREQGISHNFSAPRTPQKNGVVGIKNRTLEDMSRTMLL